MRGLHLFADGQHHSTTAALRHSPLSSAQPCWLMPQLRRAVLCRGVRFLLANTGLPAAAQALRNSLGRCKEPVSATPPSGGHLQLIPAYNVQGDALPANGKRRLGGGRAGSAKPCLQKHSLLKLLSSHPTPQLPALQLCSSDLRLLCRVVRFWLVASAGLPAAAQTLRSALGAEDILACTDTCH